MKKFKFFILIFISLKLIEGNDFENIENLSISKEDLIYTEKLLEFINTLTDNKVSLQDSGASPEIGKKIPSKIHNKLEDKKQHLLNKFEDKKQNLLNKIEDKVEHVNEAIDDIVDKQPGLLDTVFNVVKNTKDKINEKFTNIHNTKVNLINSTYNYLVNKKHDKINKVGSALNAIKDTKENLVNLTLDLVHKKNDHIKNKIHKTINKIVNKKEHVVDTTLGLIDNKHVNDTITKKKEKIKKKVNNKINNKQNLLNNILYNKQNIKDHILDKKENIKDRVNKTLTNVHNNKQNLLNSAINKISDKKNNINAIKEQFLNKITELDKIKDHKKHKIGHSTSLGCREYLDKIFRPGPKLKVKRKKLVGPDLLDLLVPYWQKEYEKKYYNKKKKKPYEKKKTHSKYPLKSEDIKKRIDSIFDTKNVAVDELEENDRLFDVRNIPQEPINNIENNEESPNLIYEKFLNEIQQKYNFDTVGKQHTIQEEAPTKINPEIPSETNKFPSTIHSPSLIRFPAAQQAEKGLFEPNVEESSPTTSDFEEDDSEFEGRSLFPGIKQDMYLDFSNLSKKSTKKPKSVSEKQIASKTVDLKKLLHNLKNVNKISNLLIHLLETKEKLTEKPTITQVSSTIQKTTEKPFVEHSSEPYYGEYDIDPRKVDHTQTPIERRYDFVEESFTDQENEKGDLATQLKTADSSLPTESAYEPSENPSQPEEWDAVQTPIERRYDFVEENITDQQNDKFDPETTLKTAESNSPTESTYESVDNLRQLENLDPGQTPIERRYDFVEEIFSDQLKTAETNPPTESTYKPSDNLKQFFDEPNETNQESITSASSPGEISISTENVENDLKIDQLSSAETDENNMEVLQASKSSSSDTILQKLEESSDKNLVQEPEEDLSLAHEDTPLIVSSDETLKNDFPTVQNIFEYQIENSDAIGENAVLNLQTVEDLPTSDPDAIVKRRKFLEDVNEEQIDEELPIDTASPGSVEEETNLDSPDYKAIVEEIFPGLVQDDKANLSESDVVETPVVEIPTTTKNEQETILTTGEYIENKDSLTNSPMNKNLDIDETIENKIQEQEGENIELNEETAETTEIYHTTPTPSPTIQPQLSPSNPNFQLTEEQHKSLENYLHSIQQKPTTDVSVVETTKFDTISPTTQKNELLSTDLEENVPLPDDAYKAAIPDVDDLRELIPVIVDRMRNGLVTAEEAGTLENIFGSLWPVIVEEAKKSDSETVSPL